MEEETVGQRLKRVREQAGVSRFELAKLTDIPPGSIRNWEQGIRMPRLDVAAKIAVALNVSLDELAGISGKIDHPRRGRPRKE